MVKKINLGVDKYDKLSKQIKWFEKRIY
jgi:hypothetical protein